MGMEWDRDRRVSDWSYEPSERGRDTDDHGEVHRYGRGESYRPHATSLSSSSTSFDQDQVYRSGGAGIGSTGLVGFSSHSGDTFSQSTGDRSNRARTQTPPTMVSRSRSPRSKHHGSNAGNCDIINDSMDQGSVIGVRRDHINHGHHGYVRTGFRGETRNRSPTREFRHGSRVMGITVGLDHSPTLKRNRDEGVESRFNYPKREHYYTTRESDTNRIISTREHSQTSRDIGRPRSRSPYHDERGNTSSRSDVPYRSRSPYRRPGRESFINTINVDSHREGGHGNVPRSPHYNESRYHGRDTHGMIEHWRPNYGDVSPVHSPRLDQSTSGVNGSGGERSRWREFSIGHTSEGNRNSTSVSTRGSGEWNGGANSSIASTFGEAGGSGSSRGHRSNFGSGLKGRRNVHNWSPEGVGNSINEGGGESGGLHASRDDSRDFGPGGNGTSTNANSSVGTISGIGSTRRPHYSGNSRATTSSTRGSTIAGGTGSTNQNRGSLDSPVNAGGNANGNNSGGGPDCGVVGSFRTPIGAGTGSGPTSGTGMNAALGNTVGNSANSDRNTWNAGLSQVSGSGTTIQRNNGRGNGRSNDILDDLIKVIPGGRRLSNPMKTAQLEKLEEDSQRLRELVDDKQRRKRQILREWKRIDREMNSAGLRAELAESSLLAMTGETKVTEVTF